VVVVVQGGLLPVAEAARVVVLQIIIRQLQAVRPINQTNHRVAKDLVIVVEPVNTVHLALTYGVAAAAAQELKEQMLKGCLEHHKALQAV
jgi:hypothetical protein